MSRAGTLLPPNDYRHWTIQDSLHEDTAPSTPAGIGNRGGVERIIGVVCMVGFAQLTTRIAIVTTVHNSTVEFLLAITGSLVLHRAATQPWVVSYSLSDIKTKPVRMI
jgi:hypothetical protein